MKNINLLKAILSVQSKSKDVTRMVAAIKLIAEQAGASITEDKGNLYVVKGTIGKDETYPCIVAHTDTVHAIIPDEHFKIIECEGNLLGFNTNLKKTSGIGGDDKVGIYIALSMLFALPKVKAAFFRDEEIGCIGSGEADMSFFDDVRFVLQCDRKGNKDFVNSISGDKLQSQQFMDDVKPLITKYGYDFSTGGTTDVHKLRTEGLKVSSANMSCGYYNPHSDGEVVVVDDVFRCEEMVFDILSNLNKVYDVPALEPKTYYGSSYGNTYGTGYGNNYGSAYGSAYRSAKKWGKDDYDEYGYPIPKKKYNSNVVVKAPANKIQEATNQKNKKSSAGDVTTDKFKHIEKVDPGDTVRCFACCDFCDASSANYMGMCKECDEHHVVNPPGTIIF